MALAGRQGAMEGRRVEGPGLTQGMTKQQKVGGRRCGRLAAGFESRQADAAVVPYEKEAGDTVKVLV